MKKRILSSTTLLLVFMIIDVIYLSSCLGNKVIQTPNMSLIVEEYRIVSQDVDTPDHLEFGKRIPADILEKRKNWRKGALYSRDENRIIEINKKLEPFQYKLVKNTEPSRVNPSYHFYHGNKLLLKAIGHIGCFTVDSENKKFLFTAYQPLENGPPYGRRILFINGEIEEWRNSQIGCPRLFNGSLMWVHMKIRADYSNNYAGEYAVMKDGKEIYSFSGNEKEYIVSGAIKSFFIRENNWILEYMDNVIINGENIGKKKNYSKVFHYQYLRDNPLYFFEKNSKIGIFYKDRVLSYQYDEVIHYQCCEPGAFNIRGNENMVWFYALKDGFWYYVEIGIYE